jgi:hypothetical protein
MASASRPLNALATAVAVTPASLALTPVQARLMMCSAALFLIIARGLARIRCAHGIMNARVIRGMVLFFRVSEAFFVYVIIRSFWV